MFHLRKFKTYTEYETYLKGGDIYLPRVTLIVNAGDKAISIDKTSDEYGPTWVDFSRIGNRFVQIVNGGAMVFTNQYAVDGKYDYIAVVDDSTGDIEFNVYLTGTTERLTEDNQVASGDYNKYSIKYLEDGTVEFPQIDGVSLGDDGLLTRKLFYLDDIARLDDGYIIAQEISPEGEIIV